MSRQKSFARWLFVLASAVQILLPAGASFADGWLDSVDGRRARQTAHIEKFGSTACGGVHADDCVLCRVVNALAAPAREMVLPESIGLVAAPAAERAYRTASSLARGLPASRAPPRPIETVEGAA